MALNYTLTMIKPGAVMHNHIGPILGMINEHGFIIRAMKLTRLRKPKAEIFYEIHKDKPFFDELVEFMCSGPIVAAILEKENAVEDFRDLIGTTNPDLAKQGTIRHLFAESLSHNAIHGSDSDENAIKEAAFFFPETERFIYDFVPFRANWRTFMNTEK